MALQEEHRTEVEEFFGKKESVEQEQTPSTFKSGEEIPVSRVDGFYKVSGIDGVFSSRQYAEQAYREYLIKKTIPVLDKEIRAAKKREKLGLCNNKETEQIIEKKKEWLETH